MTKTTKFTSHICHKPRLFVWKKPYSLVMCWGVRNEELSHNTLIAGLSSKYQLKSFMGYRAVINWNQLSGFVARIIEWWSIEIQGEGSTPPEHSLPKGYYTKPPIPAWRMRTFLLGRCVKQQSKFLLKLLWVITYKGVIDWEPLLGFTCYHDMACQRDITSVGRISPFWDIHWITI
jgi:hypothetical protein